MFKRYPFYNQLDAMDCGATCLRMIAKYHGRHYSLDRLRELTHVDREGVSMMGISDAAEHIGMRTLGVKISYSRLSEDIPLPCIAHWRQNHFIVIYKVTKKYVLVGDPGASGVHKLTKEEFLDGWTSDIVNDDNVGVLLLLETTPDFYEYEGETQNRGGFGYMFSYLFKYKQLVTQLVVGLLLGSVLQLVFPFFMQAIVDTGITNQNISFVYLILIAQFVLFITQTVVVFIRGWILLHIGVRVNVSLISDFLTKLMRLPVRFFDTKMTGDLLQRIFDNRRIEQFLSSSTLFTIFSMVNFVVFAIVLLHYSNVIFIVFLIGTLMHFGWVMLFMQKRRELDYKRFDQLSDNQSNLIQIINGMQEIKLHNAERQKRWKWERIQARLFRVSMRYLAVEQWQTAGASVLNETKNILISFLAAKAVIDYQMTLGMMLAVQYIIGQLNGPVEQLVNFIRAAQDAKISLERMNEIHTLEDEEDPEEKITILPENCELRMDRISFQYSGPHSPMVLKDITFDILKGKTTAIVGTSGSGKTTILKLLLNIYEPTEGSVRLGDLNLANVQNRLWRDKCGAVLQDGYIFSDTIAKNIALGDEVIDKKKLLKAVKVAHIQHFIESLPLGYNTKIGQEGVGLSQGQKQRMLIARAVYKDPEYIFFDEATNALDANNEMIIMDNLDEFFRGKTVVVVAHRLSTVRSADQIIVLEKGEIIERGTHDLLTLERGAYFHLVRNQLELGI